jgi:tellurite resistance protein
LTRVFARIPASLFGMLLGLIGLGIAWREASALWAIPGWFAEAILGVASLIWLILCVLYAGKLWTARAQILAEWGHPIQSSFLALIPITTMLVSIAVAPHAATLALTLFLIAFAAQVLFLVWHTSAIWRGERTADGTTPALYIPTVAGGLVSAIAAAAHGLPNLAVLCFGAGIFGWLALDSIIQRRPIEQSPMPPALRPVLGIQFGPPTVGCVAYLAITTGPPDLLAQAMLGYGILQALILIRLLPWVFEQPFAPSYWAFSFGTAALSVATLRCVQRGITGPIEWLALPIFVIATLIMIALSAATVRFLMAGKL